MIYPKDPKGPGLDLNIHTLTELKSSWLKHTLGGSHTRYRTRTQALLMDEMQQRLAESLRIEITAVIEEQHAALLSKVKMSFEALGVVQATPEGSRLDGSKLPNDVEQPAVTRPPLQVSSSVRAESFWWEASLMTLEQRLIHLQAQMSQLEQHVFAVSLEGTGSRSRVSDMSAPLELAYGQENRQTHTYLELFKAFLNMS